MQEPSDLRHIGSDGAEVHVLPNESTERYPVVRTGEALLLSLYLTWYPSLVRPEEPGVRIPTGLVMIAFTTTVS